MNSYRICSVSSGFSFGFSGILKNIQLSLIVLVCKSSKSSFVLARSALILLVVFSKTDVFVLHLATSYVR